MPLKPNIIDFYSLIVFNIDVFIKTSKGEIILWNNNINQYLIKMI
ncbi:MAG: hypothetical protein GX308_03645 [Epulopiscium sp.]|nr:hypothetical protein [Candidatus Epulonipiscium sp.]